ncbi:hypothetical protein RhiJN_24071 [Ceratobasidium sp. AG-Ba]|nr:hypothetical protein RhiJN_24071 [Ceratobasidium sp. AG-Ba]
MENSNAFDTFIAVVFEQRKALIRRDSDYRATVDAIKNLIGGPLKTQPIERLALSVYIGELNDSCDIHPAHWEDLLPYINRVVVRILPVEAEPPAVNGLSASDNDKPETPPPFPIHSPTPIIRSASTISINDSEDEKTYDTNPRNSAPTPEPTNDDGREENSFRAWEKRRQTRRGKRRRKDDSTDSIEDDVQEDVTSSSAKTDTRSTSPRRRRTQSSQKRTDEPSEWLYILMETQNPLGNYVAVEYNGQKVLIPRDPSYQGTVKSIKQVFYSLRDAAAESISISVYLREHNECYEFDPANWQDLLPRVDHAVVKLCDLIAKDSLPLGNARILPSEQVNDEKQPRELHVANPGHTRSASVISISDSDSGEALINNSVLNASCEARTSEKRAIKIVGSLNDTPRKSKKGRWSFSGEGIAIPAAAGRKPGDIHFSNDKASPTGYRYWVVEDEYDPQWVPREVGDAHPIIYRYKLRPSYKTTPPGWALEGTLREQFTGRNGVKPKWSL